jgi:MFS family permease
MLLPRVRERYSRGVQVAVASLLYALAMLALAYLHDVALLAGAMIATGVAWITILSSLQIAAQLTLPEWVRARGLAAFVVVFMGGMALGSVLWGQVASWMGIPFALTAAAVGMVAAVAFTRGLGLGEGHARDFRPSMAWTPPVLVEPAQPDRSTMVTIEYRVQDDKRAEFVAAMREVREMRRRNGAYFWQLYHDSANLTRYLEVFMDESWTEHLRQHERASNADREIQRRAKQYMVEGATTDPQHWLAEDED